MKKEKFLIVGAGGRESAFAIALYQEIELYAIMNHANPTIIDCVKKSKGEYILGDSNSPKEVTNYAIEKEIDYVFVSADDPLANGVIDMLLEKNIKAIGGTKEATRIEWDKVYSIELVKKVCPEFTPFFKIIHSSKDIDEAISQFEEKGIDVVVKPQGLTGGKGVKVMPQHLKNYKEAKEYSQEILNRGEKVLLVERLEGIEFTIMGITDGNTLKLSPASYDYPYRYENDKGAGTGGMGCFTNNELKLPFMSNQDLEDCRLIMKKTIEEIQNRELYFNGVLNGGFFITNKGIKFMEFNGRFGDPEGLNILSIMESSFAGLIKSLHHKNLQDFELKFQKKASVIKYLVAKEYPKSSPKEVFFKIEEKELLENKIKIYHGADTRVQANEYKTLKKSRVLALGAISNTITEAAERINFCIDQFIKGELEFRKDIGTKKSITSIEKSFSKIKNS